MYKFNQELKGKLPLIVTNMNTRRCVERRLVYDIQRDENGIPVRNENGGFNFINNRYEDVVIFKFRVPLQFTQAMRRPKQVSIDNIVMFNKDGEDLYGHSVHASFQQDIDQIDHAIGFVIHDYKPKTWNVGFNEEREFHFWFRDMEFRHTEPHMFVVTGFLHF